MISKSNCSASRAIIVILFLSTLGCASHPLAQEWDWSFRQNSVNQEKSRIEQNREIARIERENPEWKRAVSDDIAVVNCNQEENRLFCHVK